MNPLLRIPLRHGALLAVAALTGALLASACSQSPERGAPEAYANGADKTPVPPPPSAVVEVVAAPPAERKLAQDAATRAQKSEALGRTSAQIGLTMAPVAGMPTPTAEDRERYAIITSNSIHRTDADPVSTLSVDVDTGAYANVRRFLRAGQLPPSNAVRVEEMINYFDYAYNGPRQRDLPFGVQTELGPSPWNPNTHLLHIGIQGWKPSTPPPASNLVFLVDVSGSMQSEDKLPLVQTALSMLVKQLGPRDRISIVTYAGNAGTLLEPTPGDQKARILEAIRGLQAGGSTAGAAGIEAAYALARQAYIEGGSNRVILATDGDFNVGITSFDRLLDLVRAQRRSGIALTTLGFGSGNYNEQLMEQAADVGNGNYAYIDSAAEAHKLLVRQREATLLTIARDVKIQVEFNPAVVSEYRLIGYENRLLRREDFSNDQVDAGEIGAGHTVTALYEVALVGEEGDRHEPLRYGKPGATNADVRSGELAFVRLRYKRPQDGVDASSLLIEQPVLRSTLKRDLTQTSDAYRLSAAVAGFGQLLRSSPYLAHFGYAEAQTLAAGARGRDRDGDAGELLQLMQLAGSLQTEPSGS